MFFILICFSIFTLAYLWKSNDALITFHEICIKNIMVYNLVLDYRLANTILTSD